jgi:hypothetical protein
MGRYSMNNEVRYMNEINVILDKDGAALSTVPGIQSIVLGGSRARGTHEKISEDSKRL